MQIKHIIKTNLSPKENNIISKLEKIKDEVAFLNIDQLCKKTNTSTATFSRLIRKIGFRGLKSFKYWCYMNSSKESTNSYLSDVITTLTLTKKIIDPLDISEIAKKIFWDGKVSIIGSGNSLILGSSLSNKFKKINIKTHLIDGDKAYDMLNLEDNTTIIIISNTGISTNLKYINMILKRKEHKGVVVVVSSSSKIIKELKYNYHLFGASKQEENISNSELPLTTNIEMQFILDKIFIGVYNQDIKKHEKHVSQIRY